MRFDNFTNFSWNQDNIRSADTYYSTNVLDFGTVTAELKAPDEPWSQLDRLGVAELLIQVTDMFIGGTSVAVTVEVSSTDVFTIPVALISTPAILAVDLIAGYKFAIKYLPEFSQRYLRMKYVSVGAFTAGKITAGFVLDRQTNK